MRLRGKTALVTGAASGIGRATVLALVREGAAVLAVDRDEQQLQTLAAACVHGDRLQTRLCDVADEAQVAAAVAAAVELFGSLTTLVNNAGVCDADTVATARRESFQRMMDVNVWAIVTACRAAIPHMIEAGGGSIVNTASGNSFVAQRGIASYCASKGAALMLTKAIAFDHGAEGIRCNCVCPGSVDTPINAPHYDRYGGRDAMLALARSQQPLAVTIVPEDIAQAIAYLASDAARMVTGTSLIIDGGVLAGVGMSPPR